MAGRALEKRWDIAAYQRLLGRNERFMLSEYSKFLERQAKRTQMGELPGGSAEALKLAGASAQIREILALKSEAASRKSAAMPLDSETALAQSVIEVFSVGVVDPLKELDARLSEQQRLKVADLERELGLPQQQSGRQFEQR
jgi:hypothetical protein